MMELILILKQLKYIVSECNIILELFLTPNKKYPVHESRTSDRNMYMNSIRPFPEINST